MPVTQPKVERPPVLQSSLALAPYALTLFLSSSLLFLIQPLVARMLLPRLGGAAAVWNTCMVFFQATLLLGYLYAHVLPQRLGLRRHAWLHLLLLTYAVTFLPLHLHFFSAAPPVSLLAVPWILGLLAVSVGLPLFAVSTTAPLLQRWFAAGTHRRAADPYFLYAASNAGSMIGLLAYPLVLEPLWPLPIHRLLWALGYGLLILLVALCALLLPGTPVDISPTQRRAPSQNAPAAIAPSRIVRWVLLAFVPSSLLLSVSNYLSTEIAAVPLLWVIPLALYLLSFILVFGQRRWVPRTFWNAALPRCVLLLALVMLTKATDPAPLVLAIHLLVFFVACMACHGELAADRPAAEKLTSFYLAMSLGGVLGGLFNAFIALALFTSITEYPLVLILAPVLMAWKHTPAGSKRPSTRNTLLFPLALGLLTAALILAANALRLPSDIVARGILFGVPIFLCYLLLPRPTSFALALAAIFVASWLYHGLYGTVLFRTRTFFGTHTVTLDPSNKFHVLMHGNTVHGMQSLDPAGQSIPRTYYHPTGPIGQLFAALPPADPRRHNVAIVGLGTGSIATYAQPGERFTYFEIDPAVIGIATNPAYFTFLHNSRAQVSTILGDARLTLAQQPDHHFGLIILDAFSADSIPLHLLTREALRNVYLPKLAPHGIMAFHLSNRYLDLLPVISGLIRKQAAQASYAAPHDPALAALYQRDEGDPAEGKFTSIWALVARQSTDLGALYSSGRWAPLSPDSTAPIWTDDATSILPLFVFHQ